MNKTTRQKISMETEELCNTINHQPTESNWCLWNIPPNNSRIHISSVCGTWTTMDYILSHKANLNRCKIIKLWCQT